MNATPSLLDFLVIFAWVLSAFFTAIVISGLTSAQVRRWLRLRERLIYAADSLLTFGCWLAARVVCYDAWLYRIFLTGSAFYLAYEVASAFLSGAVAQAVR